MDYRFLINRSGGQQQRMLIQAQVWAPEWVSGPADPDDDDQPVPRDWFTADQWSVADPPAAQLGGAALRDICDARGWAIAGDFTTEDDGVIVVPVQPANWEQVLQAAVQHRNLMRRAWESAESAWMGIVAGVPRRKGEDGHVSAIEIARMGDISRYRVYQIQDEVDHPEEKRKNLADARRRREAAKLPNTNAKGRATTRRPAS